MTLRNIPKYKVISRIAFENPWWADGKIDPFFADMKPRAYFASFFRLVRSIRTVRRAPILMGPRRVGKTVLLFHVIAALIADGMEARRICYLSVEHPVYNGLGLEDLTELAREASGVASLDGCLFIFDEIQYLKDWEVHLKSLVDSHRGTAFVGSGSAAAALRLKSIESGAGRFTDFLLPPLTFHEYITLLGKEALLTRPSVNDWFVCPELEQLNALFMAYLNFGGYPEVALSPEIQRDPARYVRHDIIDKVLLRDLPSLYGIADIQELNSLFTALAFNTANEISLDKLSQRAGVAKNTIKRYLEYLEAAFLVQRIHRIDQTAKRFQRATYFKVYLTNPSLRAALFSPIGPDDDDVGDMVETAVFAQWFHSHGGTHSLAYARWKDGEVDLVNVEYDGDPEWACEVKWSDRFAAQPRELVGLVAFCKAHSLEQGLVTTRTVAAQVEVDGVRIECVPTSIYCYTIGYNAVRTRDEDIEAFMGGHDGARG